MVRITIEIRILLLLLLSLMLLLFSDLPCISGECITWGNKFDVPLDGNNLLLNCILPTGKPVCCEATDDISTVSTTSRGVGNSYENLNQHYLQIIKIPEKCEIMKTYHSSPQEIRDLNVALQLQQIQDFDTRFTKLMDYVTSPEVIVNSTKWLSRISYHMTNTVTIMSSTLNENGNGKDNQQYHEDDLEFLSYFKITKNCESSGSTSWLEWIEPVTITARHPFAFGRCRPTAAYYKAKGEGKGKEKSNGSNQKRVSVSRSNVDYVLLQSGAHLYQQNHDSNGHIQLSSTTTILRNNHLDYFNSTIYSSSYNSRRTIYNKGTRPPKFFMLDSGTSTFDSSLFWFTCGYSQNKVSFDQVYAWELTLLEPTDYWQRVPAKWIPYWHFFNIPISSDEKSHNSPIRHIKSIATPEDFVAFKLDIDNPNVEMPIALELLKDPDFQSLVDEFFFELHFQCEVMTSCGWGKRVPKESHGLLLDRPHALKFFIELRQNGIRAHIWP